MRNQIAIGRAESGRNVRRSWTVHSNRGRSRGAALGLIAAAVCLTVPTAAAAQGDHDRGRSGLAGRINVFISPAGEPFRAAPGQPYPVDVWFARADSNHDGALSLDEFVADAASFFHKLDVNGDGVIDGFEITNYEQKIAPDILPRIGGLTARDIPPLPTQDPEEQRRRDAAQQAEQQYEQKARPGRGGPVYEGAAVFGLIREPEPVAAADADFDGKVTLKEMTAAAKRRFAELDLNHDGMLARAELPKTPAEKLEEKAERKRKDRPR